MPKIASILATLLALAATSASAAPVDWNNVGLRVAYRQVLTPVGPRTLPYVLAVQQDGGAHLAGVLPGDAVSALYCGPWGLNFLDGSRGSDTAFPNYESVGAQDVAVTDPVVTQCRANVDGIVTILKPPGDKRPWKKMTSFKTGPTNGAWLTSSAAITGARETARADITGGLDSQRAEAMRALQAAGCATYPVTAANRQGVHPAVNALAQQSARLGQQENMGYWKQVRDAYCSISRNGPLPSFEAALFLMHQGNLQPCAYDPKVDYAAIPPDYNARTVPRSRYEYEGETRFNSLLTGLFNAQETACLTRLMRQQLSTASRD